MDPSLESINSSGSSVISSNQELATLFEEYTTTVQNKLLQKMKDEEHYCRINHDNPENYAKCMYAFQKDIKDDVITLNFKTTFLKRKMEECIQGAPYKSNRDEGTKNCIKLSKDIIDLILGSLQVAKKCRFQLKAEANKRIDILDYIIIAKWFYELYHIFRFICKLCKRM